MCVIETGKQKERRLTQGKVQIMPPCTNVCAVELMYERRFHSVNTLDGWSSTLCGEVGEEFSPPSAGMAEIFPSACTKSERECDACI